MEDFIDIFGLFLVVPVIFWSAVLVTYIRERRWLYLGAGILSTVLGLIVVIGYLLVFVFEASTGDAIAFGVLYVFASFLVGCALPLVLRHEKDFPEIKYRQADAGPSSSEEARRETAASTELQSQREIGFHMAVQRHKECSDRLRRKHFGP